MNIIAGIVKGRKLEIPKGIRPTAQKVKEALFNILGDRVKKATVLDLFAGSGSLGIEALSHGAKEAVFVDNNFVCINAIKQSLKKVFFLSVSSTIQSDFKKALSFFKRKEKKFDIIFVDPPYGQKLAENVLQEIAQYDILLCNGILIVEHFKKEILSSEVGNLVLERQRKYGDTILALYRNLSAQYS